MTLVMSSIYSSFSAPNPFNPFNCPYKLCACNINKPAAQMLCGVHRKEALLQLILELENNGSSLIAFVLFANKLLLKHPA